ncbi:bromodomain testis-specific protein-like [Takifugu rubripes]|uniref:bromodomain testis-specific protein-like n=1 Tax=Takifugu rubripes TaxID=31033 RepID=UPI001145B691|nr:bromodomain testis-specific protein-like [Takifugu rubripes]
MECVQDVLSIFINCYTFHKPTDDIILKAKTLQAIFLNKINTMPKLEWDIESEPTRQRQNPTEISKLTSHKPFHRRKLAFTPNENNKVLMWDDDHRPRDSVASRASTVSSGMSLRENSRFLFCKPHQQTHENSTPPKKMRTELQQEIAFQNCGELMELKKHQEEKTHLILRCGEEVSRPPDKHTAAERERLKKEAQTRRRMEADLNRFDLTLQSNLMAEFEEKFL